MTRDLEYLRGATHLPTGLCQFITLEQQIRLRRIIVRLGYYSGDKNYPIEHPTELISARDAYYSVQDNYLNSSCSYCRRRIEVLNILLEEIEHD